MIKRILFFAIIYISAIPGVFSQSLKFGFKVGTDIHKVDGISFDQKFTFGYHLGVFADIGVTSKWGIQPEVYFSQTRVDTGSHFSQVYQFKKIPKLKFGYINIPVLLNYKPSKHVAIQLGPQYSIIVNNNLSLVQNGKDAFKNGDFGIVAGLQIAVSKIRIYGRYIIGLSDLNDIDDKDSWKGQTIHLGIGLTL